MVTPSNIPANIEALIQDQILSWMRREQQQVLVSLQNIHENLLPLLRSIKEVQEWRDSLPIVVAQVPSNDLSLVTYVTFYVIQACHEHGLSHDIAPIIKTSA